MAVLTRAQVEEMRGIIEAHTIALAVETVGPETVPVEALNDLVDRGIIDAATAAGLADDWYANALTYGMAVQKAAQLGQDAGDWTTEETDQWLERNPIPLGPAELHALDFVRRAVAEGCKGLGRGWADEFGNFALEEDDNLRRERIGQIRDAVEISVRERETAGKLRSRLGDATGDWARDLERIAETELQNAHSEGTAQYIGEIFGADEDVSKIPNPDACDECRDLYLDKDGRPKVFKLSVLTANGSNVGRKRRNWKPVVDATHPYCHCTLVHVPRGFGFNEDWSLVPEEDL